MPPDPDTPFLRAEGISKRFGRTQALRNVSVSFHRGEVHALMGENGAGKSTLGKIIAGLHAPDDGRVVLDGHALPPGNLRAAYASGVRLVHQELAQCPNLSVAENLCLHDLPRRALGLLDRRAMEDRAARLVHDLEPGLDVRAPLGNLSPGRRQVCQIAAALDRGPDGHTLAKAIVFDEPTSSLSAVEADRLLTIIRRLAAEGITIIYVSHRMGEIFAVCDRVTVLRDGDFVATSPVASITEGDLIEQMIGRRLVVTSPVEQAEVARVQPVLSVRHLSSPGKLRDINLDLHPGEVLGIGGLVGAGRSELLNAVFGLDRRATGVVRAGDIFLAGSPAGPGRHRGPGASITAGLGYAPEDRRLQGLFFDLDIRDNMLMPRLGDFSRMGVLRRGVQSRTAADRASAFSLKAASTSSRPGELSGGNQQKLLLARWMTPRTRVLLLDEPTRGIDIGTKSEVHRAIRTAAYAGTAVLLVSSELPELLSLASRVIVLHDGRVAGELIGPGITQPAVLKLATSTPEHYSYT
ncbi:MAG: D-ribose transporter ATP-binding protein [Phycisphaerae bacterium]|nr:MAG: D-ribose transporter ATP-binding protein [Phycisphaerae bacterium]